jgi:hypothetical protein
MERSAGDAWTGRAGFVLAAIGGAIGLGNIWRFSYVAGENGGAVFLLVYGLCVVLIGIAAPRAFPAARCDRLRARRSTCCHRLFLVASRRLG